MNDLELFTASFIEAMYFTETGQDDQPAADAPLDEALRLDIEADCRSWWRRFGCFVMTEACICTRDEGVTKPAQAGHDFWMTRNHHGCGFWDGDWSDNYSKMFTDGSHAYGQLDVYAGDNGELCG